MVEKEGAPSKVFGVCRYKKICADHEGCPPTEDDCLQFNNLYKVLTAAHSAGNKEGYAEGVRDGRNQKAKEMCRAVGNPQTSGKDGGR